MTNAPHEPAQEQSAKIDTTVPHSARIWNYWLGGKDNYEVDRVAGEQFREIFPEVADLARTSRHFLARTVRYLAVEAGVRQFLDIGAGLPTVDNTHEIAQRAAPESRIVYVDNDPLVLAHAHALLTGTAEGAVDFVDGDLHDPGRILEAAEKTLDLSRPVGLIFSGVLGHVAESDEVRAIISGVTGALSSGSYLSLNDGTVSTDEAVKAQEQYNNSGALPYHLRTPQEIIAFFDGLELVEPGVVPIGRWRPEPSPFAPASGAAHGGVGRKP
ncbi:SAM-dependent methyltransferase [Streptomyces sp. ACA25]|uniref:SAM-dependent methyltransferase n=1 Tax=Streptomyces sp. ACA25 TaxID=3022596 RepID=UPI002307BB35|nr:SAM-dependent methyltransferase [Streptomyces sp. ACA25]MDB1090319.1 SAM-dependent methyltransferase [Streptomyces sp. ACA25]